VWSIASVHHWSDLDPALAEVWRVLEPGGRFVAIERGVRAGATGLASHGWTGDHAEAFAGRCRAAGLDEVRIARSGAGRRAAVGVAAVKP
jgi:ubiquinone/menaquinone biosynthesis C-methylase UbiE